MTSCWRRASLWGVAALAVFLFSCGAIASAQEHRFEVSLNTGHANPPFVRGRVRPWLAGGIGYVHAVDRQQMISVSGDESLRGYFGETPLGALNALWSVGIGVGF